MPFLFFAYAFIFILVGCDPNCQSSPPFSGSRKRVKQGKKQPQFWILVYFYAYHLQPTLETRVLIASSLSSPKRHRQPAQPGSGMKEQQKRCLSPECCFKKEDCSKSNLQKTLLRLVQCWNENTRCVNKLSIKPPTKKSIWRFEGLSIKGVATRTHHKIGQCLVSSCRFNNSSIYSWERNFK